MKSIHNLDNFARNYFDLKNKKNNQHFRYYEYLNDLVWYEPEKAWPIILELVKRAKDKGDLAFIAAGPLENLINDHGAAFIERIEAQARQNTIFAWIILCVWPSKNKKEIYERFTKLQKSYENHTIDFPESE